MCAEGGANLPIAHALCLPEPTKKTNLRVVSLRFAPVLWPPSDLDVEKYVEGKKKEKEDKERKNNAKFSGYYVRPRMQAQRSCARITFASIFYHVHVWQSVYHPLSSFVEL